MEVGTRALNYIFFSYETNILFMVYGVIYPSF